jgi:NADPH-dependent curcumin reductase CurA
MNKMSVMNKKIVLVERPSGELTLNNFKLVETALPPLQDGEVLLKTLYFSLDPYMRPRMNEVKGSYVECFQLDVALDGAAVCMVEDSKNEQLKIGDVVLTTTGWQTYTAFKPEIVTGMPMTKHAVMKVSADVKPSLYLGALGMPGLTAYHGLFEIGQPKQGETVVVSAATGAVGAMVGQLAKMHGSRVVGIAGGESKCQYAVRELGFDACVNYKSKSFTADLKTFCPRGVDVYFENVGGPVFKAILPRLNNFARIPVCGAITYYNDGATLQEPGFGLTRLYAKIRAFIRMFMHLDKTPIILSTILGKRIKMQGFIIADHFDRYGLFLKTAVPLVQSGKIIAKEDIVKGIENAPAAFIRLLQGGNFGKMVIEI